ncbi:unnamed protein product [Protopolystoma xenopodis]|uniref:Uncharacterized protein n=1 Tax=Protopolystoma xenopodis TaxID=117903 RepID=A0A448WYC3_9PLAT|nr:unnamed protein product [Protopolystoma xenopodis]
MIALDSSGILLGVALLDVWQRADVPHRRRRVEFQLYNPMKSGLDRSSVMDANPSLNPSLAHNSAGQDSEASREEQVREVLDGILDWVVLKADPKMANIFAPRSGGKHTDPILGRVHFADAFLLKPNGRRDCLLLVANRLTCHPPLPLDTSLGGLNFRVYALINESRFIFAKHGVQEGIPIRLENVHTADPDDLLEDKSLLVVPDLLFDTLRKVMLRELVTSSSPAAAAAVVATHLSDPGAVGGPTPYSMVHCTKFVILDRRTRTPLAIAFDSPVRLALQIPSDSTPMPVPWSESGANDSMATRFDRITAGELKAREVAFRATTAEYRLVGINGLLYALQIDDQRVVRKAMELLPARHETIFPSMHQSSMCALSATADPRAVEATVRIVNEESNSSTVFPVSFVGKSGGFKNLRIAFR